MRIYVLGSVNIDRVYRVGHVTAAGETQSASSFEVFPGGKGYNQTTALARAGANVCLVGAIGANGSWLLGDLRSAGADVSRVATTNSPTGHAVIQVDGSGANAIVVSPGANALVARPMLEAGLSFSHAGDFFLAQNETSCVAEGLELAKKKGLVTFLNPSPFDAAAAALPLGLVDVPGQPPQKAARADAGLGEIPGHPGNRLAQRLRLHPHAPEVEDGAAHLQLGVRQKRHQVLHRVTDVFRRPLELHDARSEQVGAGEVLLYRVVQIRGHPPPLRRDDLGLPPCTHDAEPQHQQDLPRRRRECRLERWRRRAARARRSCPDGTRCPRPFQPPAGNQPSCRP